MLRDARLQPNAGGKTADRQSDQQHHGEREQILRIADGEAVVRRDEKKIEQRDRQHRGGDRRSAAVAIGHHQHADKVDHDQVGRLEAAEEQPCQHRRHRADRSRRRVRGPAHFARVGLALVDAEIGLRARELIGKSGAAEARSVRVADQLQVETAQARRHRVDHRSEQQAPPAGSRRPAHHEPGRVLVVRKGEQFLGDGRRRQHRCLCPELLGKPQVAQDAVALSLRQPQQARRLHVHRVPFGVDRVGQTLRRAHQLLAPWVRSDRDHDAFACRPDRRDRLLVAILAHLRVDAVGRLPQGHFAQRN